MAKYKVLKRTPYTTKDADNNPIQGEMVEFVQIPDEGPSQVQVYFVPDGKTDAEILGVAAKHHEDELKARGVGFIGMQSPMNGVPTDPEPIMNVVVSGNETTAQEAS